jgi:hypothetical protein
MPAIRFVIATALLMGFAPPTLAGTLSCVIHDRALHMSLTAAYDYGVGDSVKDVSGNADILWDGTPAALSAFTVSPNMVHRVKLSGEDLILEVLNAAADDGRTYQALVTITGKRVKTDKTTFRSSYHMEIGRLLPVAAMSDTGPNTVPVKILHAASGYAECTAS